MNIRLNWNSLLSFLSQKWTRTKQLAKYERSASLQKHMLCELVRRKLNTNIFHATRRFKFPSYPFEPLRICCSISLRIFPFVFAQTRPSVRGVAKIYLCLQLRATCNFHSPQALSTMFSPTLLDFEVENFPAFTRMMFWLIQSKAREKRASISLKTILFRVARKIRQKFDV